MNRNIKFTGKSAVVALALIASSCNDFLDTVPDDRTEIDAPDKVTKILVSAYPAVSPIYLAELSSDNAKDNGSLYDVYGQLQQEAYLWRDVTSADTDDSPTGLWDACYNAIASANTALQAIEEMGNPVSLQPQKGEALLCRAFAHFQLATVFCQTYNPATSQSVLGIPYMTKPETTVITYAVRGNLEDTYAAIERDIEAGVPLIDDAIYSVPKYHFNKKAACAFAARFYLYYLKYDKVIEYADKVLGTDATGQTRDWQSFSELPTDYELRCNTYISHTEPCNLMIQAVRSSWPYTHGPYGIGLRYGNAYSVLLPEILPGPWGAYNKLYISNGIWGFEQKYSFPKIIGYFEYVDKTAGIGYLHMVNPVFTTDELIMCRAEAYLLRNASDQDKAVADINVVLKSMTGQTFTKEMLIAYYKSLKFMPVNFKDDGDRSIKKAINPQGIRIADENVENLVQCILHVRRLLTVHEGLRWFDIKRYGIEVTHNRDGMANDVLTVDDPRRAIQLPQEVIAAGLEANPR